ncbi:hypothetical protein BIY24_10345 [Halobacteriovorax marinus]|uniref:hypothetical protein n=1 Tax=Halobacteriovorax marinus TaxID=97084 RepID=UPI000BC32194|nr:hypothetical protein [Halobacteriovorax marinus]ATH08332.1 hypothetical protein BIY24_10345 [Halobacteriovorax marinus]
MKTKLLLTILALFCIDFTFAQTIEVKSLNQGSCWIQESSDHVKMASFSQGISVELNDITLGKIHELGLPTSFQENLKAMAFCSGHGLSLVMNAKEGALRYCVWLKVEKDNFIVQSVGLTDSQTKCDGYKAGVILLSLGSEGVDKDKFIEELEQRSHNIEFKSYEVITDGMVQINLNESDFGREEELAQKFSALAPVKYAERSYFYHPIGEWSDLDVLGRE